jgi:RimJ/RimL family protein N-acetyltransferase
LSSDLVIREAKSSDAAELNKYLKTVYSTSEHLITHPDEFTSNLIRQRSWISKRKSNPEEACFLALQDKKIVAMLEARTDPRRRVKHCSCFAMSVAINQRGKRIGTKLLEYYIAWVKHHPTLTRIELHVHSDNKHAMKLYKRCGFELEGTRKGAVKYEDGRIVDDHIMALWPKGETS